MLTQYLHMIHTATFYIHSLYYYTPSIQISTQKHICFLIVVYIQNRVPASSVMHISHLCMIEMFQAWVAHFSTGLGHCHMSLTLCKSYLDCYW